VKGQMIGIPFIFYLLFSFFDMGTLEQFFSILAFIGLIIILKRIKFQYQPILIAFIAFVLLISPILNRLIAVPIYLFNYGAFIFPFVFFIILYVLYLYFLYIEVRSE